MSKVLGAGALATESLSDEPPPRLKRFRSACEFSGGSRSGPASARNAGGKRRLSRGRCAQAGARGARASGAAAGGCCGAVDARREARATTPAAASAQPAHSMSLGAPGQCLILSYNDERTLFGLATKSRAPSAAYGAPRRRRATSACGHPCPRRAAAAAPARAAAPRRRRMQPCVQSLRGRRGSRRRADGLRVSRRGRAIAGAAVRLHPLSRAPYIFSP